VRCHGRPFSLPLSHAPGQDILWLPNATDAGVPTIKGYHWWRAAERLLPPIGSERGVRIAAKVDDDSFLHIGNLVADMRRLHCASHLHYGSMAYTGSPSPSLLPSLRPPSFQLRSVRAHAN